MTESTLPPEPPKDATADELEADIAATREQLSETIDALEDKLNVSAQARRKVDQTKTQLSDKVNARKAEVTTKVVQTKTQLSDKIAQTRGQVADTVAQTKARFTNAKSTASEPVVSRGFRTASETSGASAGASPIAFAAEDKPTESEPGVSERVKNISTRLAEQVAAVTARTKAGGDGHSARRLRPVNGAEPATTGIPDSTDPSPAAFTSTATAVTRKVGQARLSVTRTAGQVRASTRQNPRSALPAAGAVGAAVAVGWLILRANRKPGLPLDQA